MIKLNVVIFRRWLVFRSGLRGGVRGGGEQRDRSAVRAERVAMATVAGRVRRVRAGEADARPAAPRTESETVRRGVLRGPPSEESHGQLQRRRRAHVPLRHGSAEEIQVPHYL